MNAMLISEFSATEQRGGGQMRYAPTPKDMRGEMYIHESRLASLGGTLPRRVEPLCLKFFAQVFYVVYHF